MAINKTQRDKANKLYGAMVNAVTEFVLENYDFPDYLGETDNVDLLAERLHEDFGVDESELFFEVADSILDIYKQGTTYRDDLEGLKL